MKEFDTPRIIFPAHQGIIIKIFPHCMTAHYVWAGIDPKMKEFPHIDNLYSLPLSGLLQLAREFFSELNQIKPN